MSSMSHGCPVSLVCTVFPMGPLPSPLRWLLTGVFPSHQGPGRWKALSQLSGKHLEGVRLKSVGGLSEGRGDCAGTCPSPGSSEGGGLCRGIWPRWAEFPLLPSGQTLYLEMLLQPEGPAGLMQLQLWFGGRPRWVRLAAGARGWVGWDRGTLFLAPFSAQLPWRAGWVDVGLLQAGASHFGWHAMCWGGSLVTQGAAPLLGTQRSCSRKCLQAAGWLFWKNKDSPCAAAEPTPPAPPPLSGSFIGMRVLPALPTRAVLADTTC